MFDSRATRPHFLLLFACVVSLILLACPSPRPPPAPSPGVEGYDEAQLQALVRSGLRYMTPGPCRASWLLGVLDDDEAGKQLDVLLERAASSRAEAHCVESIAAARIVRRGRLGMLDLETEIQSPSPIARVVTLRYGLGTQQPAVIRKLITAALTDDELDVRVVAYRAAAALADPELVGVLTEATPADENEEFWRCTALARLQPSTPCPEPSAVREVIPVGEVEPFDRCARAQADLATERRQDALWFYLASAFRERVEPLDRIELARRADGPCLLDEAIEDDLLTSDQAPAEDQAIVAAAVLWRRHEAIGMVREKRVQLTDLAWDDSMRSCSSSSDCPSGSKCFRPPGRQHKGVCGNRGPDRDERGTSVYVIVGSSACWSFMDCPAFYSCYYPDPASRYGVCVR